MNIRVIVDFDKETQSYSAVCPELPGCATFGDTEEEAFRNMKEAMELYLSPDESYPIGKEAHVYQVAL